jgi:hypothetical protein
MGGCACGPLCHVMAQQNSTGLFFCRHFIAKRARLPVCCCQQAIFPNARPSGIGSSGTEGNQKPGHFFLGVFCIKVDRE